MKAPARFCVVGDPIAHSASPGIHTNFASQFALPGFQYERWHVVSSQLADALDLFLSTYHASTAGLNITAPHKQAALLWAQSKGAHVSARALSAQAINTLGIHPTKGLWVDNTDGVGLVNDLSNRIKIDLAGKDILILGAGGAVRGVLGPLLEAQVANICIVNRTQANAQILVDAFSDVRVSASSTEAHITSQASTSHVSTRHFDVVISATSNALHSAGLPLAEPLISTLATRSQLFYDMTYAASPTALMQAFTANGCPQVSDGLGMLVEQAAQSFYLWHGLVPQTSSVYASLRHVLTQAA